jgi:outer membrane protein
MTRALVLALLVAAARAAQAQAAPPARAAAPDADGPLSLERAVATALANQPALRGAQAQTRAAQARARQGNAALLPQARATGDVTRADTPAAPAGTIWSLGLSASQTLFDVNAWYTAAQGRSAAAAQAESERATRLEVVLAARTAWYLAASAGDLVAVAKETLANREAHLRQIQAFVEVGTRPEIDLAQARADRASAVVDLIVAENTFATAHAELNRAMGVAASTDYALAPAEHVPLPGEEGTIDELLREALAARPDVLARARQREAQVAALRAAQGGYVPTLDAGGRVVEAGPAVDQTQRSWSAGLTLTWSFLEGGRTLARASEAQAQIDAIDADDEAFRQAIRLELEQARLGVRSAKAALEATAEAGVSARERLRLAEARYQAGLGSGLELNDAQVAVTTAAAQEVKARFGLDSARAQLAKALGRT